MKRLAAMMILVCMLFSAACAEPYTSGLPRICTAESVDISRVRLEHGRLIGEIILPESVGKVRLLIDCPLPEPFAPGQQQRLTVSFQKVTSDLLDEAMASIGQSTEGGELRQFISDPLDRMVKFELERELSHARVIPRSTEGHAKQAEMEKARQVLYDLADALGIALSERFLSVQRNTFADLNGIHSGESSASLRLMENNERTFLYQEKKYGGRSGMDSITLLRAMYELEGLPVMNQRYWLQGGEAFGAPSELLAAVNDEGRLVHAEVWGIPIVEKRESQKIAAMDWQTFLREWVAAAYSPSSHLEEYVEHSDTYGDITHYGSYEVITCIAPCWVGREKFTLEPGWYGITERRLLSDDSVASESLQYISAVDFARVF